MVLSAVIFVAGTSWAKPEPPEELTGIFIEISELEGKFESGKWKEAGETVDEIGEKVEKISGEIKAAGGEKMLKGFDSILKNLEKSIAGKNEKTTERFFIALQSLLFKIMDGFSYKVHPVFQILKKYSADEAVEAAERGDFKDVESEMRELLNFQKSTRDTLMKHGVKIEDLAEAAKEIQEVNKFSKLKDKESTKKHLTELVKIYDSFVEKSH
jgi:hypothetical protein